MSFFSGRKERYQQVPTMTGQQQDFLSQLLGGLGAGGLGGQGYEQSIQKLLQILNGSPEAFAAYEAPMKRQFQEETMPNILERFSGSGARSSSGLQQTLAGAGEKLSENLASQRANLQQNAISQLLGNFLKQSQLGLGTKSFENVFRPGQQSGLERLLGGLGGIGNAAGQAFGSGMGGNLAEWLSRLFGG
jgi:hypothetical protein